MGPVQKRILAFLIDYLVILVYAAVLLGLGLLYWRFFAEESPSALTPVTGQIVGFFTLTLPVAAYFFFFENSNRHATPGKWKMGLRLSNAGIGELSARSVLMRNIVKLLPWEMAHTSVHWIMYNSALDRSPSTWLWLLAVLPQLMVVAYVVSILLSGGRSSLYDRLAGTRVTAAA